MTLPNLIRRNLPQWIPVNWMTSSVDVKGEKYEKTDNVALVVNKLTEAFISGEVINPHKGMTKPNLMQDWTSLETRFYWLYKIYGVGYLYCKDSSVWVLENDNYNPTFKTKSTIFNTEDYMSSLRTAQYTSNNNTIDLLRDGGEIIPIYDLGMNESFDPIVRLEQIDKTCELSQRTTLALIGAMVRTAMTFIFKKEGDKIKTPMDKNDEDAYKEKKGFGNHFNLKDGAVQFSNQPLEIVEANPDTKRLQGIEIDVHTTKKISTQLGLAHTLVFEDAKYDNAQVYILMMYEQTIIPDSVKFYDVINSKFKTNMSRDYTEVLRKLTEVKDETNQEGNQEIKETN